MGWYKKSKLFNLKRECDLTVMWNSNIWFVYNGFSIVQLYYYVVNQSFLFNESEPLSW